MQPENLLIVRQTIGETGESLKQKKGMELNFSS